MDCPRPFFLQLFRRKQLLCRLGGAWVMELKTCWALDLTCGNWFDVPKTA